MKKYIPVTGTLTDKQLLEYNESSKSLIPTSIISSNFSHLIYVDAISGDDTDRLGIGQSGYPYKTLEAARDAASPDLETINNLTQTINTRTITGFSSTDTLVVGMRVSGDGIPYGTVIDTISTNSITISTAVLETKTGTASLTFYSIVVIHVLPGDYIVTTTDTNGLYKDGVDWYFYHGANIVKKTAGQLFHKEDPITDINILGYGNFNSTNGCFWFEIIQNNLSFTKIKLEGNTAISTSNHCIYLHDNSSTISDDRCNLKFDSVISSGGTAIYSLQVSMNIDILHIRSTASYAMQLNYYGSIKINAKSIVSTASDAIYGRLNLTLFAELIQGLTYGMRSDYQSKVTGLVNKLYCPGQNISYTLAGTVYGGNINAASSFQTFITKYDCLNSLTDGAININRLETVDSSNLSINGASTKIDFAALNRGHIIVNSGTLMIDDMVDDSNYTDTILYVNGGKVHLQGVLTSRQTVKRRYVQVNGGVFILEGRIEYNGINLDGGYKNECIEFTGGVLVINSGTLFVNSTNTPKPNFIQVPDTNTNPEIRVLAGGLSINTAMDILAARKWKVKFTVTADNLETKLYILGTLYIVSAGTKTKAQIVTEMIGLLPVSLVCTQDIPGTDEYFYVEYNIDGESPLYVDAYNMSLTGIQENSMALVNTTNGLILADINII